MTNQPFDDSQLNGVFSEGIRCDGAVQCVFSTSETIKVGTGTTTRKHVTKIYWYIEEIEPREFQAYQINESHVPSGDGKLLTFTDLMRDYVPELEFFEDKVLPAMDELSTHLKEGETYQAEGKLYSAQDCFNRARAIDEQNVRALFNLGLIYMELHDLDKARDMVRELLNIKSAFDGKNQHLFNEFGIALRKCGLLDEAVSYYSQALEYTTEDENLFYNLARVHFERSDWHKCTDALDNVFRLNPDLKVARQMVQYIHALIDTPSMCERNSKQCVPPDVAHRINDLYVEQTQPKQPATPIVFDLEEQDKPQFGRARSGWNLSEDLEK
ncbi:tetratricopeptide repeat protein [Pseudodesulfovibrio sp. zrk46]|uniref:tetratricopeptide repeat protein n=1 Tax=Pseudodesulfovibrio sp. zrk46 TaxID=2725288 RepID=UPI001448DB54|nr:tetratricopeptide repeat protein [Pseudodesulfovibrio sp. zrk46]QJB55467.1 tetratricopeptide repeat protein [Pseudodesulfovibrio sp. zrk46]